MNFYLIVCGPLVALSAAFLFLALSGSRAAFLATMLTSCLALAFWGCLLWILRDGLEPDTTASTGLEALRRFVGVSWPLFGCWGVFVLGVVGTYQLKQSVAESD